MTYNFIRQTILGSAAIIVFSSQSVYSHRDKSLGDMPVQVITNMVRFVSVNEANSLLRTCRKTNAAVKASPPWKLIVSNKLSLERGVSLGIVRARKQALLESKAAYWAQDMVAAKELLNRASELGDGKAIELKYEALDEGHDGFDRNFLPSQGNRA